MIRSGGGGALPCMNSSRALASALVLVGAAVAGCGSGEQKTPAGGAEAPKAAPKASGPAKQAVKVSIDDLEYKPAAVRVKAGGTVTFTNAEKPLHTAETRDGRPSPATFDTMRLEKGDSKTVTFEKPGTYNYICGFHSFMTGTVEVAE